MTKVYRNQEFRSLRDRDSGAVFSDIEFQRCHFANCTLSITRAPALRPTVRNMRLLDCSQLGCSLKGAIIEDTVVDGFDTRGRGIQLWARCSTVLSFVARLAS